MRAYECVIYYAPRLLCSWDLSSSFHTMARVDRTKALHKADVCFDSCMNIHLKPNTWFIIDVRSTQAGSYFCYLLTNSYCYRLFSASLA